MKREEMHEILFGNIVKEAKDHETDLALHRTVSLDPSKLLPSVQLQGNELGMLLEDIADRLAAEGLRATEGWSGSFEEQTGHAIVEIVTV